MPFRCQLQPGSRAMPAVPALTRRMCVVPAAALSLSHAVHGHHRPRMRLVLLQPLRARPAVAGPRVASRTSPCSRRLLCARLHARRQTLPRTLMRSLPYALHSASQPLQCGLAAKWPQVQRLGLRSRVPLRKGACVSRSPRKSAQAPSMMPSPCACPQPQALGWQGTWSRAGRRRRSLIRSQPRTLPSRGRCWR